LAKKIKTFLDKADLPAFCFFWGRLAILTKELVTHDTSVDWLTILYVTPAIAIAQADKKRLK